VYIPATRGDAVLLVAHADVCGGFESDSPAGVLEDGDIIRNANPKWILGADDRAGCAMVSILGPMLGHGMLITDGEESHFLGAKALLKRCGALADELQSRYQFLVELDCPKGRSFEFLGCGTDEFMDYVSRKIKEYGKDYNENPRSGFTDIGMLAKEVCGVNLGVGYYDAHRAGEYLKKSEWLETLDVAMKWLGESDLPRFTFSPAQRAFRRGAEMFEDKDKDYEKAILEFTEAIRLDPHFVLAYNMRGRAYDVVKQYDDAINDFTEAIRLDPSFDSAYHNRGLVYDDLEQYDKAIADFNESLRQNPKDSGTISARAGAYCQKKEYGKAIKDCSKAIKLSPYYALPYLIRAEVHYEKDNYGKVIKDSTAVIGFNPKNRTAWLYRAMACHRKRDYDNAIKDFTEAIRLDPTEKSAFDWRGDAYRNKMLYDEAISDYTEVIKLDPDKHSAYDDRGRAHHLKKEYDAAIRDFNEALRLKPDYTGSLINRGKTYIEQERYDDAISDFDEALRLDKADKEARWQKEIARRKKRMATPEGMRRENMKRVAVFSLLFLLAALSVYSQLLPSLPKRPSSNYDWFTADTSAASFWISTAEELAGLADIVNYGSSGAKPFDFKGRTVTLAGDIDISAYCRDYWYVDNTKNSVKRVRGWTPVGIRKLAFNGTFDGNGKTVSGLYIDGLDSLAGLFGKVGGVVKNLSLKDVDITAIGFVGAVAGVIGDSGVVSNCRLAGTVSGTGKVGGAAGLVCGSGSVVDSYFEGAVSGNEAVGGLAGWVVDSNAVINSRAAVIGAGINDAGVVSDECESINAGCACRTDEEANASKGGIIGWFKGWLTQYFLYFILGVCLAVFLKLAANRYCRRICTEKFGDSATRRRTAMSAASRLFSSLATGVMCASYIKMLDYYAYRYDLYGSFYYNPGINILWIAALATFGIFFFSLFPLPPCSGGRIILSCFNLKPNVEKRVVDICEVVSYFGMFVWVVLCISVIPAMMDFFTGI